MPFGTFWQTWRERTVVLRRVPAQHRSRKCQGNQPLPVGDPGEQEYDPVLAGRLCLHGGFRIRRLIPLVVSIVLLPAGCGGGELSLTEYVQEIRPIFDRGIERYEALVTKPEGLVLIVGQGSHLGFEDEGARLTDFTPQDLHVALEQVAEIQAEALEAAAAINPPEQVAELHELYFRELPIAELAVRAGTAADWYELSESSEMAAYRAALAADNEVCAEFQATLDATADRGVFADTPWIPDELKETVNYALACDALPPNPEDAYRPPPTTTP